MAPDSNVDYENIKLNLNSEITKLIESRGILENEIRMVIQEAENSGVKLYEPDGDRSLAKKQIGDVLYFVEYRSTPEHAFEVVTAYCCKSKIMEE